MDGRGGMKAFRSPAQYDSIASLKAEGAGIRSDIGAAFIDHTDDPQGRAHAFNMQPIGALPLFKHLPNRIFLLSHRPQPIDHVANAVFIEHQTVQHGRRKAFFAAVIHIKRVGLYDIAPCGPNIFSRPNQGRMFALSGGKSKFCRGGFCGVPNLFKSCLHIHYRLPTVL